MISIAHIATMARYNRWQNQNLLNATNTLPDAARRENRGAFFGTIHGTFSHLLWGDGMWMHRFMCMTKPQGRIQDSAMLHEDWGLFCKTRNQMDESIIQWSKDVNPAWLATDLSWFSPTAGRDVVKPIWLLVTHMFNHQTHHRGQIHAMLTQAGAKPDVTDLPFMPD